MPKTKRPTKKAKKPEKKPKKISDKEFEEQVISLAKKGLTAEKIGESLRQQGIHPKEHKKISKILKEKFLYINPDIKNISAKLERVTKHLEKNKQDKRAKREKDRLLAQIRKFRKYLKEI